MLKNRLNTPINQLINQSISQSTDQAIDLFHHLILSQTTNFRLFQTLPFTKRHILDSSKLKEFADDNLKFDEDGRKFSEQVENTLGKGEIARYEQFPLFLQCFQKACIADT